MHALSNLFFWGTLKHSINYIKVTENRKHRECSWRMQQSGEQCMYQIQRGFQRNEYRLTELFLFIASDAHVQMNQDARKVQIS